MVKDTCTTLYSVSRVNKINCQNITMQYTCSSVHFCFMKNILGKLLNLSAILYFIDSTDEQRDFGSGKTAGVYIIKYIIAVITCTWFLVII